MADVVTPDIETVRESTPSKLIESGDDIDSATPDVHSTAMILERAGEAHKEYTEHEEEPARAVDFGWYLYGFCSYFIHTVLIPIVFPLIISQVVPLPTEPVQGWDKSPKGFVCEEKEMKLYQRLIHLSIPLKNSKFSPLEWTSISWFVGLLLVAPILGSISFRLDNGHNQPPLIAAVSIATGAIFCLPAGVVKTVGIFLPYIAAIVAAHTVATTCNTRYLGLMVRGYYTGATLKRREFHIRRTAVAGRFSLYATVAGCFGSAIMSAFTYRMLQEADDSEFISLWIVSIFSGLLWLVGILHVFTGNRNSAAIPSISKAHALSIFKYPYAIGSLAGVFLSSFTTMCIFTGALLFVVGQLCLSPESILYFWLTYFLFPLFSLPLLQPLQHLIKADAVKMQLLGFFLSVATSGAGFYFRDKDWQKLHVFLFAAIQSTSTGLLHAFGLVLLLACSPSGKEGAFSIWFAWTKALGTFAGFAVASAFPGKIGTSFGIAFWAAISGIVILIFGNLSDFDGAVAAGHVREDNSERVSSVEGLDTGVGLKELMHGQETP